MAPNPVSVPTPPAAPLPPSYVAHGFAVCSLNYRLLPSTGFPGQVEDCKAAVRWLRAHASVYALDPTRFGAFGTGAPFASGPAPVGA